MISPAEAGDWPQFLGPHRNGISDETGLLDKWPAEGPKELWRIEGGVGMSGVAIARERAITMVQTEGKQWLLAVDANTGKAVWKTPLAKSYENEMGNGPRATPSIAGDRVLAFTGEGILVCVKFSDGSILWQHDPLKEFSGKEADYGMACSPLVVGKHVVVTTGAPQACVVAYEIETGKLAWSAGTDRCGYSSPALLNVNGSDQLVAYTGSSALGIQPEEGKVLWRFPYVTDYDCNIATPLAHKGQVFISSGENHGSALLKISASDNTPTEVWGSHGPRSVLRCEWQTPILLDGHLYGFDNVGSAGAVSHFTCVNADTGERVWQEPRFGKGNLISADGKLWISTMKGELVLAEAATEGYRELGRKIVIGTTRQMPTLANGRLYLRDNEEIVCLDVKK
ncbi:MAG TPA: PQQ-binding-like beta-propeller repeat protein [Planctomycetaceae bacterium]|nr:PQQ-binding-like beta-propeller repeat protein [Planctomycetaceae bacterium]